MSFCLFLIIGCFQLFAQMSAHRSRLYFQQMRPHSSAVSLYLVFPLSHPFSSFFFFYSLIILEFVDVVFRDSFRVSQNQAPSCAKDESSNNDYQLFYGYLSCVCSPLPSPPPLSPPSSSVLLSLIYFNRTCRQQEACSSPSCWSSSPSLLD